MWNTVLTYIEIIRTYNTTAALTAFFIGFFFPKQSTAQEVQLFFGFVIVSLLHSIATVQNDIEDWEIDLINAPQKPLQRKELSVGEVKRFLYILLAITVILGCIAGPVHLVFIGVFLMVSWLYNNQPFLFSHTPIVSILLLGLAFTSLPMVYGLWLNHPTVTILSILWLTAWFFIRMSISILKDYKDEIGDRKFNKRTFYLTFGKKITAKTSLVLSIIGYIGLFTVSLFIRERNVFIIVPIIFAFISFIPRIALLTAKDTKQANTIFHTIFFRENRLELLYLLWLIFS